MCQSKLSRSFMQDQKPRFASMQSSSSGWTLAASLHPTLVSMRQYTISSCPKNHTKLQNSARLGADSLSVLCVHYPFVKSKPLQS